MASIATLLVKIAADPSELDKGLKKSERTLENWGKRANKIGKEMSKWVTGPIAGMATGLLALQRNTAQYSGQVRDMADSTGMSTDAIQELTYAMGQNGIGQDMMRRLMERNNQRIARAAEGNETFANAYKRLGVEIRDTNGDLRDSEKVFDEVLISLAAIESGATRAAVAGELLGVNAGRKLAGALSGGIESIDELRARAHDLGIVMDGEALAAADSFGNEMADLREQIAASGRNIAMDLMPLVRDLIPLVEKNVARLTDWVRGFTDLDTEAQMARVKILAFAAAGGPVLLFLSKVIQGVSKLIGLIRVLTTTMMKNPWIAVAVGAAYLAEKVISANREISNMRDEIQAVLDLDLSGTAEEYDRIVQALDSVNKIIEQTTRQHQEMGAIGTEASNKQLNALREQEAALVKMLGESGRLRTENMVAARKEQEALDALTSSLEDQGDSRGTLSAQIEENQKRIDELSTLARDLTDAEEQEIITLIGLNEQLQRTIDRRLGLAAATVAAAEAERQLARARQISAPSGEGEWDDPNLDLDRGEATRMADPGTLASMNEQLRYMEDRLQSIPIHSQRFGEMQQRIAGMRDRIAEANGEMGAMSPAMEYAQGIAMQFTDSFGQGMTNVLMASENVLDTLKNIGKLLASSAIQMGLRMLLTGGTGGGIVGGILGRVIGVNDALITSGGDVIKFHPDDNILAMKDFSSLGATRQAGTVTVQGRIAGSDILLSNARSGRYYR